MSRVSHLVWSLLAAFLCAGFANAQSAGSAEQLYWCKQSNGNQHAQKEPCAPGTEVRPVAADHGVKATRPVEEAQPAVQPPPVQEGYKPLLKILAWGLVFGVLAKLVRRSFFLGFFFGIILRIVLVAADLINF
jgi:hypothetical protein